MPLLLWLFLVPLISAALAFFLPIPSKSFKVSAFVLSLIPLIILLFGHSSLLGAEIHYVWLPGLSVQFYLRMDILSLAFVYLTAIIIPIAIVAIRSSAISYPNAYYGIILLLQALLIGFFTSRDLVVFTFFWESMLIPLYFLITFWGGPQRYQAAFKFLVYMIAGSTLMLAAVLLLYFTGQHTFNMDQIMKTAASSPYAGWICAIFFLAFAVKTPLFPFHAWLTDSYYQAPVAGTILLAALLSKAGIYGFLRIGLEFFPNFIQQWHMLLLSLAITGVLYGGLAAWMQNDFKRLLAYSSFSHVNFILAGIFIMSPIAHSGAILQALNHGVTITALFIVAWWLEERIGTTAMGQVGGLAQFLPYLCWVTLFFVLSNVALPGTNNFIGELLILFGVFSSYPWLAFALGLSVILSVMYMLRWMQKIYFEKPDFFQERWIDIRAKEFAIAAPLAALILWIGIYPAPVLNLLNKASEQIASQEIK